MFAGKSADFVRHIIKGNLFLHSAKLPRNFWHSVDNCGFFILSKSPCTLSAHLRKFERSIASHAGHDDTERTIFIYFCHRLKEHVGRRAVPVAQLVLRKTDYGSK